MSQDVKITITADASRAVAEVKKADEAIVKTASSVELFGKKGETVFTATATGAKAAGTSFNAMGQQAGFLRHNLMQMFGALAMGQTPLQVLEQQGPQVAESFSAVSDASELVKRATFGMVPSLGAAATALGVAAVVAAAAGTAWVLYANDAEDAKGTTLGMNQALVAQEVQGRLTGAQVEAYASAWEKFTGIAETASLKIDVINGKLTENGAAAGKASEQATGAARTVLLADGLRLVQLQRALQAEKDIRDSSEASFDERLAASASIKGYEEAVKKANATLVEHKAALAATNQAIADAAEYADESAAAKAREAEASNNAAAAARALARAEAEAAKQREAQERAARAYIDGLESMRAAEQSANESNLTGIAAEEAARDHALAALAATYQKQVELSAGNDAAMLETDATYNEARFAIYNASEQRLSDLREAARIEERKKIADAVAATRQAEQEKAQAVVSTLQRAAAVAGQLFDLGVSYQTGLLHAMEADLSENEANLTENQKKELGKRIEAQRDAARRAFAIAKAAKIAEAIASTALAVINAISQSPPPSPFGLIGAGIAAAAGAVSIAQIAGQEPSFHAGTSDVRRYSAEAPDEVRATLLEGEAVMSRRAVAEAGRNAINDANAGRSRSNGNDTRELTVRYRHQDFNTFIRDNIRLGGPLASALNAGNRVGHRKRSY